MAVPVALPSRLSQVLVAYTIELDNEFERRMPHQTTSQTGGHGPWLISRVMWSNFLRFLGPDGLRIDAAEPLAKLTNLGGLTRWGWVRVVPDPAGSMITPTRYALHAQRIWPEISETVRLRWRERLGHQTLDELEESLQSLVDPGLPTSLPVVALGNGMVTPPPLPCDLRPIFPDDGLAPLLSQTLLSFTLEFEVSSGLSLPISSGLLRVFTESGIRTRDLPQLTGLSKEALSSAVGFLERRGLVKPTTDPTSPRSRAIQLTATGTMAQARAVARLDAVEVNWCRRFGGAAVERVRVATEVVLAPPSGAIRAALTPTPGNWRAARPYLSQTNRLLEDPTGALPHHPMVLHRGGYPDGS